MDTMAETAQALWEGYEQEYFINHQWDNPTEEEINQMYEDVVGE